MKTFIIFDRKTGEILQTHLHAADHRVDPRDLLRMARPEAKAESVDVMEVDGLTPGQSYRVDVKARKLLKADGAKVKNAGGAFLTPTGGVPRPTRIVVSNLGEKKR